MAVFLPRWIGVSGREVAQSVEAALDGARDFGGVEAVCDVVHDVHEADNKAVGAVVAGVFACDAEEEGGAQGAVEDRPRLAGEDALNSDQQRRRGKREVLDLRHC